MRKRSPRAMTPQQFRVGGHHPHSTLKSGKYVVDFDFQMFMSRWNQGFMGNCYPWIGESIPALLPHPIFCKSFFGHPRIQLYITV